MVGNIVHGSQLINDCIDFILSASFRLTFLDQQPFQMTLPLEFKLNLLTPSLYSKEGETNCIDTTVEKFASYLKHRADNEFSLPCKYTKIPGLAFIHKFEDFEERFLVHSEYAVIIASPYSQRALNQFNARLLVFLTARPTWQNRFLFVCLGNVQIMSNLVIDDPIYFSLDDWEVSDESSWITLFNMIKITWKPHIEEEPSAVSLPEILIPSQDNVLTANDNLSVKSPSIKPEAVVIKMFETRGTQGPKVTIEHLLFNSESIKAEKPIDLIDSETNTTFKWADNVSTNLSENSDADSEQTFDCQSGHFENNYQTSIPEIDYEENLDFLNQVADEYGMVNEVRSAHECPDKGDGVLRDGVTLKKEYIDLQNQDSNESDTNTPNLYSQETDMTKSTKKEVVYYQGLDVLTRTSTNEIISGIYDTVLGTDIEGADRYEHEIESLYSKSGKELNKSSKSIDTGSSSENSSLRSSTRLEKDGVKVEDQFVDKHTIRDNESNKGDGFIDSVTTLENESFELQNKISRASDRKIPGSHSQETDMKEASKDEVAYYHGSEASAIISTKEIINGTYDTDLGINRDGADVYEQEIESLNNKSDIELNKSFKSIDTSSSGENISLRSGTRLGKDGVKVEDQIVDKQTIPGHDSEVIIGNRTEETGTNVEEQLNQDGVGGIEYKLGDLEIEDNVYGNELFDINSRISTSSIPAQGLRVAALANDSDGVEYTENGNNTLEKDLDFKATGVKSEKNTFENRNYVKNSPLKHALGSENRTHERSNIISDHIGPNTDPHGSEICFSAEIENLSLGECFDLDSSVKFGKDSAAEIPLRSGNLDSIQSAAENGVNVANISSFWKKKEENLMYQNNSFDRESENNINENFHNLKGRSPLAKQGGEKEGANASEGMKDVSEIEQLSIYDSSYSPVRYWDKPMAFGNYSLVGSPFRSNGDGSKMDELQELYQRPDVTGGRRANNGVNENENKSPNEDFMESCEAPDIFEYERKEKEMEYRDNDEGNTMLQNQDVSYNSRSTNVPSDRHTRRDFQILSNKNIENANQESRLHREYHNDFGFLNEEGLEETSFDRSGIIEDIVSRAVDKYGTNDSRIDDGTIRDPDSERTDEQLESMKNLGETHHRLVGVHDSMFRKFRMFSNHLWARLFSERASISSEINTQESTIRRDLARRYVQSPWYVFLLFFTGTMFSPYWANWTRGVFPTSMNPDAIIGAISSTVIHEDAINRKWAIVPPDHGSSLFIGDPTPLDK